MRSLILRNLGRIIFIFLLQVVVLFSIVIDYPILDNMNIIIYPLIIILLPLRTLNVLTLIIAFILGLLIDMFYNTPGVNTAATVLIAYIRPFVLSWIEPRGGYSVESSPTLNHYGSRWFITYASIMMLIHLFVLFSIQAFTFVYIVEILLKTIFSFIGSMVFIMIYMYLFNPKE